MDHRLGVRCVAIGNTRPRIQAPDGAGADLEMRGQREANVVEGCRDPLRTQFSHGKADPLSREVPVNTSQARCAIWYRTMRA